MGLLRRVLAPVRRDDLAVFPNVDLLVGAARSGIRPLHRVARRGRDVFVTPSLGRAVRAALHHLDTLASPPAELLELEGAVLLGHGGAVVVHPRPVAGWFSVRQLRRLGWDVADGLTPYLDPSTGEVVVPAPRLPTSRDARNELDRRLPTEDAGASRERWPLRGVVLLGRPRAEGEEGAVPSRAEAVAAAGDLLHRPEGRRAAEMAPLLRAVRDAPALVPAGWSSHALRAVLHALADRTP